nr:CDC42 small effector protein 2 isoform X3 [Columba livia]
MCIKLIGDLFSNLLLEERTRVTEVLQFRYSVINLCSTLFSVLLSIIHEVHVTLGTKEAYVTFLWCWDQPSERRL